jgi:hypothetical protein
MHGGKKVAGIREDLLDDALREGAIGIGQPRDRSWVYASVNTSNQVLHLFKNNSELDLLQMESRLPHLTHGRIKVVARWLGKAGILEVRTIDGFRLYSLSSARKK